MTIWEPRLSPCAGAKYRRLADALAEDIRSGRLPDGARLPPQRDVAYRLGVTVGTVGRAYDVAARAGLVSAHTGRGTFVGAPATNAAPRFTALYGAGAEAQVVSLAVNRPADIGQDAALAHAARELLRDSPAGLLNGYCEPGGSAAHRAAGVRWIARAGFDADPANVIVTPGAQSGIASAILAGSKPGDTLLAADLTYPNAADLARTLDRRLLGLPLDDEGICVEAFAEACERHAPAMVFNVATLHNPTCATMSTERRQAFADIARKHAVLIIEDDVYGATLERDARPPAIASHYREGTFFLTSLSKAFAPGLRCGFLASPPGLAGRARSAHHNLTLGGSLLTTELAAAVIASGMADEMTARHRGELQARKAMAAERFGAASYRTAEGALHLWLALPEPWRAPTFAAAALQRGVAVNAADEFMLTQETAAVHRVRVCLGAPEREQLERGLDILADLLRHGPDDAETRV